MRALSLPIACALACLALAAPERARAGGYDTPILYTARHLGMGGTAIGYVDDASAVYHNPAGLSGVRGLSLLGNVSLVFGSITSSPGWPNTASADGYAPSVDSEPVVAPFFMLAAAYRLPVISIVRAGLAVYPIASAAGEYHDEFLSMPTIDKTRLVFFEASPAVSVDLHPALSLGLGYRVTFTQLERVQGFASDPQVFDFELSGLNLAGLRAGVQFRPREDLSLGLVYRHVIEVELSADRGRAIADVVHPKTTFTLPSKLGLGVRYDVGALGLALDGEYTLQSQNDRSVIAGLNADPSVTAPDGSRKREAVTNYFAWHDALTARIGVEYTFFGALAARVGYVLDGVVGEKGYPTAFGTPPAASHSLTVGGGYDFGDLEVNLALAHRFVSTEVKPSDITTSPACATCSLPGHEYSLRMWGLYADLAVDFGGDEPRASATD